MFYTGDIRAEKWWVDALVRHPVLVPYTVPGCFSPVPRSPRSRCHCYAPNERKGVSGEEGIGESTNRRYQSRCHCYPQPLKRLSTIYLDTTYASRPSHVRPHLDSDPHTALDTPSFPSKRTGLSELLMKVMRYPPTTQFYFRAWTFGYEDVWIALAAALSTRIHIDGYWKGVYDGLRAGGNVSNKINNNDSEYTDHEDVNVDQAVDVNGKLDPEKKKAIVSKGKRKRRIRDVERLGNENAYYDHCAAALVGFREGNRFHEGCLIGDGRGEVYDAGIDRTPVRVHSCQRLATAMGSTVSLATDKLQLANLSRVDTTPGSSVANGICPVAAAVSRPGFGLAVNSKAAGGRCEIASGIRVVEIIPVVKRTADSVSRINCETDGDIYEIGAGHFNDETNASDDSSSGLEPVPSQIVSESSIHRYFLIQRVIGTTILLYCLYLKMNYLYPHTSI